MVVILGKSSLPYLVLVKVIFLTFFTRAQCEDVGCPVLVPSVCLQVTCQNITRTAAVDCLNPGSFIPQGTIATYRCLPHRGKEDNRTYTMMCICDGKWMGIERFERFRDWCAANTDTGPFVEDSQSSILTPEDLLSQPTSESGRILNGETTTPGPSVPTTTLKFLEAVSTRFPLGTTGGSDTATTTPLPTTGTAGSETSTLSAVTGTGGTEAGTSTVQPGGTGSTASPTSVTGESGAQGSSTGAPATGSTLPPSTGTSEGGPQGSSTAAPATGSTLPPSTGTSESGSQGSSTGAPATGSTLAPSIGTSEGGQGTSTLQPETGATSTSTPSNTTGEVVVGTSTTGLPGTGSTLAPSNATTLEVGSTSTVPPPTGTGLTGSTPSGLETTTALAPGGATGAAGEGSNSTGSTQPEPNSTGITTPSTGGTGGTETGSTAGQTTGTAPGTTTPTYEGVTVVPSGAGGNVSSENMVQGQAPNRSREDGGRSLFSGNETTPANVSSETTPTSGDATATTVPTTAAGGSSGSESTTAGTGATGEGATGTTPLPQTTTAGTGATGTAETAGATGSTATPITSGEITSTPSSAEGGSTGTASFITTHEPPTTGVTGEAGNQTDVTGTTVSAIQVTTTIASLTTTTTEAPGFPPVAPPENIQQAGNATSSTSEGANATAPTSNYTAPGSAPSPAGEGQANCGDDVPVQSEANFTDFQLVGLQLHNSYRKTHNVSEVKLNQTLNQKAQCWADHELTEKTLQVTPGKRSYAENLYKVSGWRAITSIRAVQEAMKTWYSSVERYNWTQPNPTGFSQIVWSQTTDIGVGVAKKDDVTIVAVTYWPRGNIILVSSNGNQTSVDSGKLFRENVFPKVVE